MAFDPLSGQGVYKAVESGLRAAAAIALWLEGKPTTLAEYQSWIEESFRAYLKQRLIFIKVCGDGRMLLFGEAMQLWRLWPLLLEWDKAFSGADKKL